MLKNRQIKKSKQKTENNKWKSLTKFKFTDSTDILSWTTLMAIYKLKISNRIKYLILFKFVILKFNS